MDNKLDSALIKKYFDKKSSLQLFKYLRYSKGRIVDDAKIISTKARLNDLKKNIRNMSNDEMKNKNLDLIAYLVEKSLDFIENIHNQKYQPDTADMAELETEESAAQRQQKGQGFKILTPKQVITRLPIIVAQLKAGDNLQKLKNETRWRKTIYNSLMNTI